MSLFGGKKKEQVAEKKVEKTTAKSAPAKKVLNTPIVHSSNDNRVIIGPRITEKATMQSEKGVYVFEISKDANKVTVSKAISAIYNVEPVKIAITKNPSKRVFMRGKAGVVPGVKKAYVYLKKGDKIEIV